MWGYYRRQNPRKANNVIAGALALFVLGLIGAYKKDPQIFYRNFGYLIFAVIAFFIIRRFIRKYREKKDFIATGARENDADNFSTVTIGQTPQARLLWAALKERGVNAITEHPDGYKTIDIAILPARLYLEVDGLQHVNNLEQVMRDLKRDDYSDREGFRTIHISNSAIDQDINSIANEIVRQARERQQYFSPNE